MRQDDIGAGLDIYQTSQEPFAQKNARFPAGKTQDRAKRLKFGVVCRLRGQHTWLPSRISGACTADEFSIGGQCDGGMTCLKGMTLEEELGGAGLVLWLAHPHDPPQSKKKPADESGLKTIFLEENSGDRCKYAASPHIRPIVILDTSHTFLL